MSLFSVRSGKARRETAAAEITTIESLLPGEDAVIVAVHGKGALRGRLLDMGFTPKTAVRLEKTAPFGDPVEVSLRGYMLTLRRADARLIEVKKGVRGTMR